MDNRINTPPTAVSMGMAEPAHVSPDRLKELERFAEIGRISAGLLHEISSPLTAAILWLEQCGNHTPYIRHARHSIRVLQKYVEAARQQIRRESNFRNFALQPELEQVKQLLAPLARRRGISLKFAQAHGCELYGDPVKFQQIVANLVRNAMDAYDTCSPGRSHKPVRLAIRVRYDRLIIEVDDRGCGIPPGQLDKLFEPFYSTKMSSGTGLGIGLSAVKHSIENDFHGSIMATSSAGRGTRFTAEFLIIPMS
jgi:signal transduction histidine kinase